MMAFSGTGTTTEARYYLAPLSTGLVPAPSRSYKMSFSARFCAYTGKIFQAASSIELTA
ncbi:hypothetical protein [Pseudochrobactrum asaccharolyticum]|uniref:hypothetical protein n=1 Tax=Pseudochrobactrum asaccharolyticum TaxID=354351 RepID=UPI004041FFCB